MSKPDQVYTTFIETSAEKVWQAIINPEFTKQYWFGSGNVSTWEKGAPWEHVAMEIGKVHHLGIVEDIVPNKRLVLSWGNPGDTHDISRVTFEIVPQDNGVKLTITHGDFVDDSAMATRVAGGWPKVVANLKELLETGCLADAGKGCAARCA